MQESTRFFNKIKKIRGGCWEWIGSLNLQGYGQFTYSGGNRAHRYSYEYHKGKIPEGLTIDHLCSNRKCVNPDHLEAVTLKVNVLRSNGLTAQNARKTHCVSGHVLSGDNLLVVNTKTGPQRRCKICKRQIAKNWRKANKLHIREYFRNYKANKKLESLNHD